MDHTLYLTLQDLLHLSLVVQEAKRRSGMSREPAVSCRATNSRGVLTGSLGKAEETSSNRGGRTAFTCKTRREQNLEVYYPNLHQDLDLLIGSLLEFEDPFLLSQCPHLNSLYLVMLGIYQHCNSVIFRIRLWVWVSATSPNQLRQGFCKAATEILR